MNARRVARIRVVFIVLAGIGCATAPPAQAQGPGRSGPILKVGDKAPPLVVEKWLKGGPIKRFEPGKLYVLEFWSTWCRTCTASIPELSELQRVYKSKGVTIIGVNVWERKYTDETLAKVEQFVKQQGDRIDYVLAYDGKGKAMDSAYMKAAERTGIPCTFLIDGQGKIAWIGYPWWLDVPLEASVAGTWDPVSGTQQVTQAEALLRQVREKLKSAPQEAAALWETLERDCPVAARKVGGTGFRVLLAAQEYPRAYKLGSQLVERALAAKNDKALNELAWAIVDPEGKVEKKDLDLALKAALGAAELTQHKNPAILDTLARVYFVKGEINRAIELQTRAVALAKERMKEALQKTLRAYEAAGN